MCPPSTSNTTNTAGELADLLYDRAHVVVTAGDIIKLIENDWEKLKRLAHAVHKETESRFAERKARAEADAYARY